MSGFNDIERNLKQVLTEIKGKALKVLAVEAEKSIKMNFEAGGRPEKWEPRKHISKRQRGRKLLVISGNLSNVTAEIDEYNNRVVIKTNPLASAYARIHQEGGVINMPARELKFRKKRTGETVFAGRRHKKITKMKQIKPYKITIPARPYLVIPTSDFGRIKAAILKAIKI